MSSALLIAGRLRSSILMRVDRGAVVGEVDRGIRMNKLNGIEKSSYRRRRTNERRETGNENRESERIGEKEELQ